MWIVCKQTIYMECQDLFSLKIKKKYVDCYLLQTLIGALRANVSRMSFRHVYNYRIDSHFIKLDYKINPSETAIDFHSILWDQGKTNNQKAIKKTKKKQKKKTLFYYYNNLCCIVFQKWSC